MPRSRKEGDTMINEHVCKKGPYDSIPLLRLWAYIVQKGCNDWIDKDAPPEPVKPKKSAAVAVPVAVQPEPVVEPEPFINPDEMVPFVPEETEYDDDLCPADPVGCNPAQESGDAPFRA